MIEYAGIYLKKQSAEYVVILNVSHEVHSTRVTVQITEQLSRQRRIQIFVKYLRWSVLQTE